MLGRLRGLIRRRGPVGALALGAALGAVTGLLALNAALAGWTYRDAARRDLRRPGRWALGVLVTGPLAFVPYSVLQWYRDRRGRAERADPARAMGPGRERTGAIGFDQERTGASDPGHERAEPGDGTEDRSGGTDGTTGGAQGPSGRAVGAAVGRAGPGRRSGSLARTATRYGGKVVLFGVRCARWVGRRVADRMNNG